jgi:topoisomerase-4 subunit A
VIGRLNTDQRGRLIGNFLGEDRIIVCYKTGDYELTTFELTNRFEAAEVVLIEKFNPQNVVSAVYYDGGSKTFFVKRFQIETTTINKKFNFITEHKQSYLKLVSTEKLPQIAATLLKGKEEEQMEYDLDMLIDVKGWKAIGNKLSNYPIKDLSLLQSKVEVPSESTENDESTEDADGGDQLEIGSTIDLTVKNEDEDQLGLF